MSYTSLNADCVIETIDRLGRRIEERFPGSGLSGVCAELSSVARRCATEADRLREPVLWIRAGVAIIWTFAVAATLWLVLTLEFGGLGRDATALVVFLDPAMNVAVLTGIGVLGLARAEERWKRGRALSYLHELRSLAHVVDMHQLTKDPHRVSQTLPPTENSPQRVLSAPLLERYLDYCSEMVSLTGKLAALFAQSCPDPAVSEAAGDIENLTTGLSRKMWQKITVLGRVAGGGPALA